MPAMGIREYARHRRVSHVAVLKAVRTGRIRQSPDGLIDSEQADFDWSRNTHPAPRAPHAVAWTTPDDFGFAKARMVRETYEARIAKLEYEQRAARLLDANEVKVASRRIGDLFKEYMLRIPDSVVARLRAHVREHGAAPSESAVHSILSAEIRRALEEFADRIMSGAL